MKKFLSILICLALALSLLPGAAFAATKMSFAFADIDAPAVGEAPSYAANHGGVGYELDAGNNNPNYYKNGVGWYDMTDGTNVPVGGSFEAGHQYKVIIYFSALEGYEFLQNVEIQINSKDAFVDYYNEGLVVGELVFPRLPLANPFRDVEEANYFYAPVLWAVDKGITTGTSATTFSPLDVCTRAQVVTFLWRAAGKPEPMKKDNPFTDVPENMYYYKAVLWAVENGITTGTSATTFSPEDPCTRAQVVTFLYRAAGKPAPTQTNNPFSDVPASVYYYNPVLWAVEMGITNGTSATTFGPEETCIRAQIVTFLYRFYKRNLEIVEQPEDYQMISSDEFASFEIEVEGGEGPYTYRWYVCYERETICAMVQTSVDMENTFSWNFTDYDFDYNREIYVYCSVTDAEGNTLTSRLAEVLEKKTFALVASPDDYQMTSSQEDATFTVEVEGGIPAYTYEWFVVRDGAEVCEYTEVTDDPRSEFTYNFSDYDFDDYREIYVYCMITDENNVTLTSDDAFVLPK